MIIGSLLPVFGTWGAPQATEVSQAETPRYGGTLIFLKISDSSTLNPLLTIDDDSFLVANQIFSSLIDRGVAANGSLTYRPDLAESWEISKDGLTYTFHLRKGVKWHDGKPFTSADVKFTYDLYLDPKIALPQRAFYAAIGSITTPDNNTVVLNLKEPSPILMSLGLAFWRNHMIIPKHLYQGTDVFTNPYNMKPIGTGPFKFVEWVKGDHITLEKNRDYYIKGLPYLDKIIYKLTPSSASQMAALETGEGGTVNIVPEPEVKRLQGIKDLYVFPVFKIGLTSYMAFNQGKSKEGNENPILQKKDVRKAILHALNRQEIIDLALGGFGRVQNSWVSSEIKDFYEPNVPKYEYNVDKANQLLDAAGYKKGADGFRFTLRLYYTAGDTPRERASEIVKSQLAKVGIDIKLVTADWPTLKEWITTKYDFDLAWFGHATGPDPDRLFTYYHGSAILPGSWQFCRYNNSEVDALWDQSRKSTDPAKRAELFKKMQMIMMEEVPIIPVQERVLYAAARNDYKGLDTTGPYWYSNHLDKVWYAKGSLATAEAADAKVKEVEAKLNQYKAENWGKVDEAIAKLGEAKKAQADGKYDDAVSLADAAIKIPTPPPPIGLYAAAAVVVLAVAGVGGYYFVRRRKT